MAVLLAALLGVLCLAVPLAYGQGQPAAGTAAPAAEQVLTWTAGDSYTGYLSAPTTAVAGPATIVFENSAATGNTMGMPHTLTFDTSNPDYNTDVSLNLVANPADANGGRETAQVTLTPGVYRYFCAMPGHLMSGELTVTAAGGGDTTAPQASAEVSGQKNADGQYIGSATVTLSASDTGSGVDRIEYALDGAAYTTYTAPVTVNTAGDHTLNYRATDKAGNTSTPATTTFTIAAPPPQDTTPPQTSATVTGQKNTQGQYIGSATITVTATDSQSGVDRIEYSLDGGPYLAYSAPVVVDRAGDHTVRYRAVDKAGNTSDVQTIDLTVVDSSPGGDCPESDNRLTVIVGDVDTGVPNRVTGNGCTINERILDEQAWNNHGAFVNHVKEVAAALRREGVIDSREEKEINKAAAQSDIGKPGDNRGYQKLLDGSAKSFARWEHVGGGDFTLNRDGSITSSTTKAGMGMLWYPVQQYGDFSLKLQFRDDAPGTANANSGVFVRFPDVHSNPAESRPEWVAIKYGHEVQIFDSPDGDQYKTGSIYGFDRVSREDAGVTPKGTWNDYEIRVVGRHFSVYRNGRLINEFDNDPGQVFSPARSDDPGTDGRQLARGYIGLQNHSTTDVISIRNVRIKEL